MPYQTLLLDVAGDGIATVTLNRPDRLNALNDQVIGEIGQAAVQIEQDPAIKGAIMTGAGPKAFAAGADIAGFSMQSPMEGRMRAEAGQRAFRRLERCGKPVIAAVNGFALGGGCELALACHLRFASEAAKFGQPEVKLGICPGYGGTVRLPRLIGHGRALDLLLSGRMIDVTEALAWGLVNRVVPGDRLLEETAAFLRSILSNGPLAVQQVLALVNGQLDLSADQALQAEAQHFGLLSGTEDMREGTRAFLEKRAPSFKGR